MPTDLINAVFMVFLAGFGLCLVVKAFSIAFHLVRHALTASIDTGAE